MCFLNTSPFFSFSSISVQVGLTGCCYIPSVSRVRLATLPVSHDPQPPSNVEQNRAETSRYHNKAPDPIRQSIYNMPDSRPARIHHYTHIQARPDSISYHIRSHYVIPHKNKPFKYTHTYSMDQYHDQYYHQPTHHPPIQPTTSNQSGRDKDKRAHSY